MYSIPMTISTSNRAAELFTLFEGASVDLSQIRKSDLAFLKGVQLSDPFYEVIVSQAEATSVDINRENLEHDGTLALRVGLQLQFKPQKGMTFETEDAVLWVVTDGRDVEIELAEIDGAQDLNIELDSVEKLLSRLS
jgi:hypothetical protein